MSNPWGRGDEYQDQTVGHQCGCDLSGTNLGRLQECAPALTDVKLCIPKTQWNMLPWEEYLFPLGYRRFCLLGEIVTVSANCADL
ncbi:hypothetical protein [Epibacterium ulvae]|uniref:hypothetical protein n=1 Tax=Epibacterium ulvae TaxID=1156985 RepID=UPI0024908FE4|nr:hypothetical protein [Epibacterium ulvae]